MNKNIFPPGFRARRQRNGKTFYYLKLKFAQGEIALGCDVQHALEQYATHVLAQERIYVDEDMRILQLINIFQKCDAPLLDNKKKVRRMHELIILQEHFEGLGNPCISEISDQTTFCAARSGETNATLRSMVGLFRHIWLWAKRHGLLQAPCPWQSIPKSDDALLMEISQILAIHCVAHNLSKLLNQILDPMWTGRHELNHAKLGLQIPLHMLSQLEADLSLARETSKSALMACGRIDLLPGLDSVTVEALLNLRASDARWAHVPPGRINLSLQPHLVIQDIKKQTSKLHSPCNRVRGG